MPPSTSTSLVARRTSSAFPWTAGCTTGWPPRWSPTGASTGTLSPGAGRAPDVRANWLRKRARLGEKSPWVTEVETTFERKLSLAIMRGVQKPEIRRVAQGEIVVEQGSEGAELFLLLDGVLGVDVDGQPLAEVGSGAVLGERAILEDGVRTSTLRAVTQSSWPWPPPTRSTATPCRICPRAPPRGGPCRDRDPPRPDRGARSHRGHSRVRLHVCGVRGSTQAPGAEFVRTGGHTSCVALAHDGEPPALVLDAGTGIRRLWGLLDQRPFRGSILLGHLHWDHTHGLPFFRAGDDPDARVDVFVPSLGAHPAPPHQAPDADALARLAGGMAPPYFPVTPDQLRGDWRFQDLDEGTLDVEGFRVLVREIPHKGGRTFGFRVEDGTGVVAYLSDHHPASLGAGPDGFGPYHPAALELAEGADVLLHDSQYTAAEFPTRAGFGHSTVDYAVGLGAAAGVGQVLLYHHDPARTDDELDAILAGLTGAPVAVDVAREGVVVEVGAPASVA